MPERSQSKLCGGSAEAGQLADQWRSPSELTGATRYNPQLTRCSSQPSAPFPGISTSLSPFGCRPSRMAATMSGATQVSGTRRRCRRPSRSTCSARLVIDFARPLSIRRRQRCAGTRL